MLKEATEADEVANRGLDLIPVMKISRKLRIMAIQREVGDVAEVTIKIGRKLKIKAILKETADVAEATTLKLEVVMTGRNNSQIKPILNLMITKKPNSKMGAIIKPEVACVVEVAARGLEEIVKVVVEAAAVEMLATTLRRKSSNNTRIRPKTRRYCTRKKSGLLRSKIWLTLIRL